MLMKTRLSKKASSLQVQYTMEQYKNNKNKGRPRIKRIRGNGDMPGDGGSKLGSKRKSVCCGRSTGSQDDIRKLIFLIGRQLGLHVIPFMSKRNKIYVL